MEAYGLPRRDDDPGANMKHVNSLWVVEQVDEYGRGWPLIDYVRTKRRDAEAKRDDLQLRSPNETYRVRKYTAEQSTGKG